MFTYRINVTEQDIKRGQIACANKCPVALSLARHRWYGKVFVCEDWARIGNRRFELPTSVQQFIKAFDDGGEIVFPFSFNLCFRKPLCPKRESRRDILRQMRGR